MEPYQIFHKSHRHQLLLLVVLILYIVLNIQTPPTLAHLIDNIYGNIAVILCAFYLLANSNPIVGVIALFAAYELIKRSSHSTGTTAIQKFLPSEMKKGVHISAFNQFPVTLEEEVVSQMAPIVKSNEAPNMNYSPVLDALHDAAPLNYDGVN